MKLTRKVHHPYPKTRAFSVEGRRGVVTLAWTFSRDLPESARSLFVMDGNYYASDLGFHAKRKAKRFEAYNTFCEYTQGQCSYDGTSLGAWDLGRLYLADGEDALFDELERIYVSRFPTTTKETTR